MNLDQHTPHLRMFSAASFTADGLGGFAPPSPPVYDRPTVCVCPPVCVHTPVNDRPPECSSTCVCLINTRSLEWIHLQWQQKIETTIST